MIHLLKYILLLFTLIVFQGCDDKKTNTQSTALPYKGQSIMVIVPTINADLIRGPILHNKKEFETKTGAKIRVVTPSWSETITSIDESMDKNSKTFYDIYVVIGLWNGSLLSSQSNIAPIPQWLKEQLDWDDVLPIYKKNILNCIMLPMGYPMMGIILTYTIEKIFFLT